MAFDFDSNSDQILFRMLSKVIRNGGVWEKQGQRYMAQRDARSDADFLKSHFGVEIQADESVATVNAHTSWASYGSRSIIPQLFMFVLDDLGVVAKYKIRGNGNMRAGWSVDASKTELKWQRDADVQPAEWMKQAEQIQAEPVGEAPQGRCQVVGTVLALKETETTWGYCLKMMVRLQDGARVYGTVPSSIRADVSRGDRVEFTAQFDRKEQDFAFFSRPSRAEHFTGAAAKFREVFQD